MRSLTPWSMWMMNWSPTWKLNGGNGYTLNATRSHKAQKTQMFKARQILQFVSFYVIIREVCNWLTSVLCGRSITFTRLSEVNSEGKIDLAPWRTKHFTILEFSFNLPFWSTPIFWNSLDISIYIQLLNNDVLGLWNQQKSCQRSSCVIAASWILSGTCQASSRFGPWQCGFFGDALRGAGLQFAFHCSASTLIQLSNYHCYHLDILRIH